ncbi:MAG: phosphate acyltransferase PlsX [Candidatus Omnitrophota bacterium]
MKIVVDAMGGDHAPEVVIRGVVSAVNEFDVEVILVGEEPKIKDLLKRERFDPSKISVVHAPEAIGMSEPAAASVRKKRKSSIVLGMELVEEGKADAFFSAGNTGAVVCAATLSLRMLPGVERPGIALVIPSLKGFSLMIDVGANIDPKPTQLLHYGLMGDVYCKYILNKPDPTVGLLNIGEEETKGTEFMKETHELLSASKLNFIGNVEGKDLYSGKCDLIISDGFVGNIALKVSESVADALNNFLKKIIKKSPLAMFGLLFMRGTFKDLKKEMDYSEYGGAPLLGVNGVVIIGHGRSNAKAIKNAIRVAKVEVERQFNEKLLEAISKK